jgi:hypothetical protein
LIDPLKGTRLESSRDLLELDSQECTGQPTASLRHPARFDRKNSAATEFPAIRTRDCVSRSLLGLMDECDRIRRFTSGFNQQMHVVRHEAVGNNSHLVLFA